MNLIKSHFCLYYKRLIEVLKEELERPQPMSDYQVSQFIKDSLYESYKPHL